MEPQIDNLYCVVLLNCFLSTGSGTWTSCLRHARLSRLYEHSIGKKGRTGVQHRCLGGLISGLQEPNCVVLMCVIGPGLPPKGPQLPPSTLDFCIHGDAPLPGQPACPSGASCHSKRMAYSPFVRLSDNLTSGGGDYSPCHTAQIQSTSPRTPLHPPKCQLCCLENLESDKILTIVQALLEQPDFDPISQCILGRGSWRNRQHLLEYSTPEYSRLSFPSFSTVSERLSHAAALILGFIGGSWGAVPALSRPPTGGRLSNMNGE